MARLTYALVPFALLAATAACSSKSSSSPPDAPMIMTADAPPPVDAMPDALVCQAPTMNCSGTCINTTTDEQNCGSCGNACKGGEFCDPSKNSGTCSCPMPANILGTDIPKNAGDQHQSMSLGQATLHIAAAPVTVGAQTNALVFLSVGLPDVNKDYTLKSGISFSQPNVLAAYNGSLGGGMPMADAYYDATGGTLRFSSVACTAQGFAYTGTLTNVTFQGATISGMNIQVDPNGCMFTVASLTFDIETTTACTP